MLNFHHYLQVSRPVSPLRHRRPEVRGSQRGALPLYALFKASPERWKNTWRKISGLLAATQHAHHIGEDAQNRWHRRQATLGKKKKKQGWGPVANLPLAVLDKPLGRILLGGLSSMELWEDLSGWLTACAPLIQAARVPIDSTCHCLKSKAAWQRHWGLVFILYSLHFGVVFGGLIELLLLVVCFIFLLTFRFLSSILVATVCSIKAAHASKLQYKIPYWYKYINHQIMRAATRIIADTTSFPVNFYIFRNCLRVLQLFPHLNNPFQNWHESKCKSIKFLRKHDLQITRLPSMPHSRITVLQKPTSPHKKKMWWKPALHLNTCVDALPQC